MSSQIKTAETKPFCPNPDDDNVYTLDLSKYASVEAQEELTKFTYIYVFYISARSEVDLDKVYDGVFVFKRLTFDEVGEVQRLKAQFCGGLPVNAVSTILETTSYMRAYLQVACVKCPDWWKQPSVNHERKIIESVFEVAHNWEINFRDRLLAKRAAKT